MSIATRPPLTRERIATTALAFIDEHGLDARLLDQVPGVGQFLCLGVTGPYQVNLAHG